MCIPLYGFWIMPAFNETRPVLAQAVAVELDKKEAFNKKFLDLQAQQEVLEAAGGKSEVIEAIPSQLAQEFLLLDLRRITQSAGFTTPGFTFSKGQDDLTNAAEMKATIAVEGDRSNLVKLLKLIEANERFMGLESLNFSTKPGTTLTNAALNIYTLAQEF